MPDSRRPKIDTSSPQPPGINIRWQLLGFFALSIILVCGLSLYWVAQQKKASRASFAFQVRSEQADQILERANDALIEERLAWNEVLLRGRSRSDYHQLLSRFYAAERSSRGAIEGLSELPENPANTRKEIEELSAIHRDVGRQRRDALRLFNTSTEQAHVLADQLSRPVKLLAQEKLEALRSRVLTDRHAQLSSLQRGEADQRQQLLVALGLAAMLALGGFFALVDRRIGKPAQRSAEIAALTTQAEAIAGIGIWDWTRQGQDIYWSAGVYRLLNIAPRLAPSQELLMQSIHPGDHAVLIDSLKRQMPDEGVRQVRIRVAVADDERIILAFAQVARTHDGKHLRHKAVLIDVTERELQQQELASLNMELEARVEERTEEFMTANAALTDTVEQLERTQRELVQKEKLAALGHLVAGIAHELNTPIGNALTVATTLDSHATELQATLRMRALRRSEFDQFIDQSVSGSRMLTANLQRASQLITDFKEVSVDQTSERRRSFDLRRVVEEVLNTLGPNLKKHPGVVRIDIPEGIIMDSYPGPLGQIVANLVMNALIHGLGENGEGEIGIRATPCHDEQVSMTFIDTGKGIPEEHQARIFDPFFTTRMGQGGSGLGLSIVHNIATTVLGGRITASSRLHEGTTITVDLPLKAPQAHSAE